MLANDQLCLHFLAAQGNVQGVGSRSHVRAVYLTIPVQGIFPLDSHLVFPQRGNRCAGAVQHGDGGFRFHRAVKNHPLSLSRAEQLRHVRPAGTGVGGRQGGHGQQQKRQQRKEFLQRILALQSRKG